MLWFIKSITKKDSFEWFQNVTVIDKYLKHCSNVSFRKMLCMKYKYPKHVFQWKNCNLLELSACTYSSIRKILLNTRKIKLTEGRQGCYTNVLWPVSLPHSSTRTTNQNFLEYSSIYFVVIGSSECKNESDCFNSQKRFPNPVKHLRWSLSWK